MEREYRVENNSSNHLKIGKFAECKLVKNEFADRVMDNAPAPATNETKAEAANVTGDMYDVEQIVDSRFRHGKWEYRIRWKGYGRAEDTWEPKENLIQCMDMIKDFKHHKKVQGKRIKAKRTRAISKSQNQAEATSNVNEDTSSENASNSLPSDVKTESQPDTFWKDFSAGHIQIREEDMYSHVKGRRAKRNQNTTGSKTPSVHSSTSNDSTDRPSTAQDQSEFNLGVLQTLSHFFDNSLQSIEHLRKPQKDCLYRSCSKLSRVKNINKKSSIMRVERVSCSTGKLMLKIKGHKLASCSYSKATPNMLERKSHNLRSRKKMSKESKRETKVPVQKASITPPPKRNLLDELFTAVVDGNSALVEELYKLYSKEIDYLTLTSVTHQLLMDALASNNWKIMEVLIRNGADINTQSTDGTTILMAACQNSNFEVVQKLLQHGAYKDKQNAQGMTALMIACLAGDFNSLVKLLNAGANFVLVNSRGQSAVKMANQAKNPKIQNFITTHVQRVKACFETEVRTALLSDADIMYALFPLHCYSLNEQSEITIAFDYQELDPNSVAGNGYIIFIAKATISEKEVSCKLDGADGNYLVTWVTLNNKKQELITVGYSCNPLHEGRNVLTIFTEQSNRDNVKLIICAYKVKLDTMS